MDWGIVASVAIGLLTGVLVPAFAWVTSQNEALRDRTTRLEVKLEALESRVNENLERLSTLVETLSAEVKSHMRSEAGDIERAVSRALKEWGRRHDDD